MGLTVLVKQDVRRLQVAMEDTPLVGVMNRLGHLRQQSGRSQWIGGVITQLLVQARSIDQLHAEVAPFLVPTHLQDRHNVCVVEEGDGLGLIRNRRRSSSLASVPA